jgi:hypothetical protein
MTDKPTDRQIDHLVKARLLEIGLSPTDLAELLAAALAPRRKSGNETAVIGIGRLTRLAKALDVPADFLRRDPQLTPDTSGPAAGRTPQSQASLMQLRLLRAYSALSDHRAQRMLVYLAEQLVKHQAARSGGAS